MLLAASSASGYIDKVSRSIGWHVQLVKGYLERKGTVMIKMLRCLGLVLLVIGAVGCKSEKPESESAPPASTESAAESEVMIEKAQEQPDEKTVPKPNAEMMMMKCPDCGGDFRPSEDKKMMVCTGCGTKIDMKTYSQMGIKRMLEAMQQMKKK